MALLAASHSRDLTDEQWVLIGPFLPKLTRRTDGRGRPWRENRAVLNGILWILRTGAPWADLPDRYPSYQTCHRRFQQWVRAGVLRGVLEVLAQALHDEGYLDLQETVIDGSFAPAKQGGAGVGKTNAREGSKIIAIADRRGLPVAVHIESATPHEVTLVHATLAQRFVKPFPVRLIGDNAYVCMANSKMPKKFAIRRAQAPAPARSRRLRNDAAVAQGRGPRAGARASSWSDALASLNANRARTNRRRWRRQPRSRCRRRRPALHGGAPDEREHHAARRASGRGTAAPDALNLHVGR
jgi:transposase